MTIVPLTEERFDDFVRLIQALADYEHLERPDRAAMDRLRAAAFGSRPRFDAALASTMPVVPNHLLKCPFTQDDEPAVATLLARLVAKEGYEVDIVGDGAAALAAIANRAPDVILLDVMLPGMGGFEICARVKQNPRTRLTPVVLITGLGDRERRIQGREAGADDFLTKPVDSGELLARTGSRRGPGSSRCRYIR